MPHLWIALGIIASLFAGMLVLVQTGRRMGSGKRFEGLGAVEGAVFGLMGLLIAFTFGSAAVRFETRRSLIVEEANDIGTAYLRLDLLPADSQPPLRDAFRRYAETRLAIYKLLPDVDAAREELDRMAQLQGEIWKGATAGCSRAETTTACMLLLPALNDMIDITTTRTVAMQAHQPTVVFLMLALVMLACALLAGFSIGAGGHQGSTLHVVAFAAVLAVAFYVILDLEWPRLGFIRIDWMDRILEDVRRSMG